MWEVARSARRTAIEDALAEEARRVLGPAPVAGGGPGRRGRVGDTGGSGAPAAALGVADGGIAEGSAAWHDRVSRDLRYAQAVVLETLRLHPSVPKNIKTALHDDVLPDGTVVRAGEYVSWMPCAYCASALAREQDGTQAGVTVAGTVPAAAEAASLLSCLRMLLVGCSAEAIQRDRSVGRWGSFSLSCAQSAQRWQTAGPCEWF